MKPSLQLRLGHQLTMTPQLQQAIRLLQLSAVDLQREIQTALESNTMLELQESTDTEHDHNLSNLENAEVEIDNNPAEHLSREHLSRENGNENENENDNNSWEYHMGERPLPSYRESKGNEIETLNSAQTTLRDHLFWQMQLTPFSDVDRLIAAALIDAINDDGYLTCTIEDIIATLKRATVVEQSEVEAVLHRIQQFDPIGVGARDVSECLKVQLDHLPPETPLLNKARECVMHHLDLLGKRDYPALRRRLGLSLEDLHIIIHAIQALNPRPGTEIGGRTPEYIVPDVYAFKKDGIWQVELNNEWTPQIQINSQYAKMVKRADASVDNQFLKNQLQEAKWFLKSIENRNETLLKVAQCIIKEQKDFLDFGEEAMKPLILHDVSSVLNLHESTISRVTTQKYLHTPRGTFELKYFFSSHVNTDQGGECSATAIRAYIKKFISNENHKKPLSDNKLAKMLAEQGINVARRTIAKYREAMMIPPSNERKQLF